MYIFNIQLHFGFRFVKFQHEIGSETWPVRKENEQVHQQYAYPLNVGGGSYNCATPLPPFSMATSPLLIVCLSLAHCRLLKLTVASSAGVV